MLKSEDEAWQLFETLSENSLHHMSTSCNDRLITQKRSRIYEIGNYMDIHSMMDELSQKMDRRVDELSQQVDRILNLGQPPTPPIFSAQQEVCAICSSPTHCKLNIQLQPNFLNLSMSKFNKSKPNKLVDQEMIHAQTHTIQDGGTILISPENLNHL